MSSDKDTLITISMRVADVQTQNSFIERNTGTVSTQTALTDIRDAANDMLEGISKRLYFTYISSSRSKILYVVRTLLKCNEHLLTLFEIYYGGAPVLPESQPQAETTDLYERNRTDNS